MCTTCTWVWLVIFRMTIYTYVCAYLAVVRLDAAYKERVCHLEALHQ